MVFSPDRLISDQTGSPKKHPAASSPGSTISTYLYHSVNVGLGGYASPLSITSTGRINPTDQAFGAVGLVLTAASVAGTITNAGFIAGGNGYYSEQTAGAGGTAVDLASDFIFTNKGDIVGGTGGYSEKFGGAGGAGVEIAATGTFTNSGQIHGGDGGYAGGSTITSYPGAAGDGVDFAVSATFINSGSILGGYGGQGGIYGLTGGDGLKALSGDLLKNTGVILGGNGSYGVFAGNGGIGAFFEYGSLTNSGTILGGDGGRGPQFPQISGGGYGGGGVFLLNASRGTNTGVIRGGNGNYGYFLRGSNGGPGVYLQNYGSFANSGTIFGGDGGIARRSNSGNGGSGLDVTGYSTASNAGVVNGGNGGAHTDYGISGTGGDGVFISQSSFTNTGKINGGAGGSTPGFKNRTAYDIPGGDGLAAFGGVVTNSGIITAGAGASGFANTGTAGSGGSGVYLNGATFTNTGTVKGGAGGTVPQSEYNNAYGGVGGAGVLVGPGATLVNDKLIIGGTGGTDVYAGNTGGDGVIIDGGVFTNAGTVTQGYGGVSQSHNIYNGDAVFFAGAGTLVAAPGAKFVGSVVSTLASGSVLELTGTSSTAFSGLKSQFIGINLISFAAGASRVLEGSSANVDVDNTLRSVAFDDAQIAGFAAHDTLVLDGFAANPRDTSIQTAFDRIEFPDNNVILNYSNLLAEDLEVAAGGGKTTLTGLGATATTLANGAAEFVRSGGTATGRINKGAFEEILTGGTVTATTIAGGELLLLNGAKTTGTIAFSGTGNILDIVSATMPTATLASFVSGDTIELSGIAYNANDKVTVGTAGIVTITAPSMSYKLNIAGATKGETDFTFSAGSLLTKGAAAKTAMGFLAPETAMAVPDGVGEWAPDFATPFSLTAFAELPPERSHGLTLLAHYDPALNYGPAQHSLKTAGQPNVLETALVRHLGQS